MPIMPTAPVQYPNVDGLRRGDQRRKRTIALRDVQCGSGQSSAQLDILGHLLQRQCQVVCVIGAEKQTGATVDNQLGITTDIRSEDCQLRRHRFEDHIGQTFLARGKNQKVTKLHQPARVGTLAKTHHILRQAHLLDPIIKQGCQWTIPGKQ